MDDSKGRGRLPATGIAGTPWALMMGLAVGLWGAEARADHGRGCSEDVCRVFVGNQCELLEKEWELYCGACFYNGSCEGEGHYEECAFDRRDIVSCREEMAECTSFFDAEIECEERATPRCAEDVCEDYNWECAFYGGVIFEEECGDCYAKGDCEGLEHYDYCLSFREEYLYNCQEYELCLVDMTHGIGFMEGAPCACTEEAEVIADGSRNIDSTGSASDLSCLDYYPESTVVVTATGSRSSWLGYTAFVPFPGECELLTLQVSVNQQLVSASGRGNKVVWYIYRQDSESWEPVPGLSLTAPAVGRWQESVVSFDDPWLYVGEGDVQLRAMLRDAGTSLELNWLNAEWICNDGEFIGAR